MPKICNICRRRVDEHPEVVKDRPATRYCDLTLVEDVRFTDGRIKTIEVDEDPFERSRGNNRRWVHTSTIVGRN